MSTPSFSIPLTPELAQALERRQALYGDRNSQQDFSLWLHETELLNRKIAIYTEIAYDAAKAQGLIQ